MASLSDLSAVSNQIAQQNNPEYAALNQLVQSRVIPYEGFGKFVHETIEPERNRQHQKDMLEQQYKYNKKLNADNELRQLNDELKRNGYQPANDIITARQQLGRLYEQNTPEIGIQGLPYANSPAGTGLPLPNFGGNGSINTQTGAGIPNPYAQTGGSFSDILPYSDKQVLNSELNAARRKAVVTGDYTDYNNLNEQLIQQTQNALLTRIPNTNNAIREKNYDGIGSSFVDFITATTPERVDRATATTKAYPFIKPDYQKAKDDSWTKRGEMAQVQRDIEDQLNKHLDYLAQEGLTSVIHNRNVMGDLVMRGINNIITQAIPGASLSDVDIATKDGLTFNILAPSLGKNIIVQKMGNGLAVIGVE